MEGETNTQQNKEVEEALDKMIEQFDHHMRHRHIEVGSNGLRSAIVNVGFVDELLAQSRSTILAILTTKSSQLPEPDLDIDDKP